MCACQRCCDGVALRAVGSLAPRAMSPCCAQRCCFDPSLSSEVKQQYTARTQSCVKLGDTKSVSSDDHHDAKDHASLLASVPATKGANAALVVTHGGVWDPIA